MAWSLGTVTLIDEETPHEGPLKFGRRALWAYFNPVGMFGRVRQYMGLDENDLEIHLFCGEVTMEALKALVGPAAQTFTAPRPHFENGVQVTIEEVDALWTERVPGCWSQEDIDDNIDERPTGDGFGLYDVTVRMVELREE